MRDMRRRLFIAVVSALGLVTMAAPAIGATEATLFRESTTDWSTPSTDPTGLTYDPRSHKFWISDSEVDETGFWKHRNLFLANRLGALQKTRRVDKATVEPEGISWYPRGKSLFVVDDDKNAIFRFGRGHDGKIGTGDDKVRKVVNTLRYGSGDAEGVTWHSRRGKLDMLIWTDAGTTKIYELKRGRDHRFGTRDDVMKRAVRDLDLRRSRKSPLCRSQRRLLRPEDRPSLRRRQQEALRARNDAGWEVRAGDQHALLPGRSRLSRILRPCVRSRH